MYKNEHIDKALKMLETSPLKVTEQRIAMIKLLFKNGAAHFTAEDIYEEVNKKKIKISLATIYNCLNQFKEFGIIKAIKVSSDKIFIWFGFRFFIFIFVIATDYNIVNRCSSFPSVWDNFLFN